MKILAISYLYPNSLYPHYGIFVHNRLKAVSKYYEVKVINPIPWFPGHGWLARYKNYDKIPLKENIDGLEVYHPRFLVIPKFFKFLDAFTYKAAVMPLIGKLYKSFPFDLVDLHWTYPDLPTGYAIKKKYNKKMLVTLRGKESFHIGEGLGRELLIKKHVLKADAVISLSQELQDMAVGFGVEEKRCHVIRNGVDTSAFYYIDKNESRRCLGLPPKETIILSVGSLNYRKGFDRIIKKLPDLLNMDTEFKLYIIGSEGPDGDYRKSIYRLIDKLNLKDKVFLKGTVGNSELVSWYNAADLFCLASRGEGSPNVLAEALACGCPAVATDVGAVNEILKEKFLGILVSNSTGGVGAGLRTAFEREWNRKKIFAYTRKFDWDWCAYQILPVYKILIELAPK